MLGGLKKQLGVELATPLAIQTLIIFNQFPTS